MSQDQKNLLRETLEDLAYHEKSANDVEWVGSKDGQYTLAWDAFAALVQGLEYDSRFGGREIADNLVVVGKDWWMERHEHEYNGSEWWEFKTLPRRKADAKPFSQVEGTYEVR